MATSMYNHHRFARAVMKKFRKAPASLTIELHSNHWLFQGQQGKLEYDGPMRPFLQALREQSIPPSLLNTILNSSAHVPIYDGCLLIEIHDFRTSCLTAAQELANQASGSDMYQRNPFHSSKPGGSTVSNRQHTFPLNSRPAPTSTLGMTGLPCSSSSNQRGGAGPQTNGLTAFHTSQNESSEEDSCTKYRVVMKPDSVSMWEQLVHLNRIHGSEGEWDDQSVLQMESRILAAIAPPLALDTSFALSRTANLAIAVTAPTLPYLSWDGRYIHRSERHKVEDQSVNAKQVSGDISRTGESSTRNGGINGHKGSSHSRNTTRGKGDAATLGYDKQEIDLFAKLGAPSVEDLSEKARAGWDEKASSPYHKLRRPGQEPPSNTIFTGQNARPGAVNADAAAAMMAIANERANGQADEAAAAAAAAASKKKPTKKKRKDANGEDSVRGGSVAVDTKAEESREAAAAESLRGKPKPKKKKDATNVTPTIPLKGKKRAADEMSEAGSVNTAVPPSPSQPPRLAMGADNKGPVFSNLPPPGKKLTKKQQRAFDAAEREKARQQAAEAAAAEQNPPKKKAKKNATAMGTGNTAFTNPNSVPLTMATPSIDLTGLPNIAPAPAAPGLLDNFAPVSADMTGQDYSQMVPPNLLDPALPPDMANMPIGEVPENIFLAAAADVDFNFPFPMGGPDTNGAGMNGEAMDFGGTNSIEDMDMALSMLQQGQLPESSSRHPGQSRAPPGS
ncbi:hypothetical protein QFC19_006813 [Naganishia cerealis]|uniref:Uncharacterized protein n=1 Tax=Naganishia cerealis TaxID=610337 RepID=A0ACC2VD72_9TREE|nr:hypothetical protein QFC19_006813 [Naganishia cerealis]